VLAAVHVDWERLNRFLFNGIRNNNNVYKNQD
jgi:hypothetical protein